MSSTACYRLLDTQTRARLPRALVFITKKNRARAYIQVHALNTRASHADRAVPLSFGFRRPCDSACLALTHIVYGILKIGRCGVWLCTYILIHHVQQIILAGLAWNGEGEERATSGGTGKSLSTAS